MIDEIATRKCAALVNELAKGRLGTAIRHQSNQSLACNRDWRASVRTWTLLPSYRGIRPIANGSRSWMFSGSNEGGSLSDLVKSLAGACKMRGLDLVESLAGVPLRVDARTNGDQRGGSRRTMRLRQGSGKSVQKVLEGIPKRTSGL